VLELVRREVEGFDLLIPASSEALLDEEAFDRSEFMPYWAELWPAGIALARAVAAVSGRVLEIGCGLGLPSLVAARAGADVISTDWAPDAIALLKRNAARNHVALEARVWDWTDDPAALGGPFDLVIAADVLYEERNHAPLVRVLPELGAEVWIADPGRAVAEPFASTLGGVMTPLGVPAAGVMAWGGGRRRRP
jgi:predicted nicotinamide N-methyase